ncbi:MAG: ATP-binding cassette domain-containing protein [Lewinellaceae bacterium]|nr:ATP-binding cassette domain-containing protein [Saprospiraceae bacterium]MCB9339374.1 ATP-binding cassette domain-containing protein [Lewinellaceae bacterium]
MISLSQLLPIPLKEMPGGIQPASNIFGTESHFEKGKNYLVIAPSGKGKSTLLHILYGLRNDYEGNVSIGHKNIRQFTPDEWAELRQSKLAIVFQDLRLFPQLTARDNILLKASLTNVVSENEIKEMAARLGVDDVLNQVAETLSYGQRQRIAIIRALCQPFEYLLLDESFSHLDEANMEKASKLMEEVCKKQAAGKILVSLGERYLFEYDEEWVL